MKTSFLITAPGTARPKVRIDISRGGSDCECCGWFDYADASVVVPGRKLVAGYDGHMGGGNWSGNDSALYYWALQLLGVHVLVNGERPEGLAYCERRPGRDWKELELCPQPQEVVQIKVHSEPDTEYPDCCNNVWATWVAPDGGTLLVEVATGWDGEVDNLYRCLLVERATVKFQERREGLTAF